MSVNPNLDPLLLKMAYFHLLLIRVDADCLVANVIKLLKCGSKIKMQRNKLIRLSNLKWSLSLVHDWFIIYIYKFYIY
jgi:hypothetical protein